VFFTTLDRDHPRQQDLQSLIKANPGMGFRPMPDVDSTLIRFEQGKPSSYKIYTDHIQAFLEQYENEAQESEDFIDCAKLKEEDRRKDKVCRFNIDDLGDECTWQKDYGYDEGTPCVLLKLNKVYGWEPVLYDNETRHGSDNANGAPIPDEIDLSDKDITVTCEGENPADVENMGPIEFFPPTGYPIQYYPYLNQRGYRQPLIFAKFKKPKNGVIMQIWCKAWAKNILHHRNDKAGSVHFEMLID
jgi:sodium/potassium-transporting ATPase subunit beta